MLSEKKAGQLLKILIPVFLAVLSIFVLAPLAPQTGFARDTLDYLEKSSSTVMEFSGAAMSTSLALSALPNDFATPLANSLANMNEYFIFILIAIFVERLLVVEGIKLSFLYVIPAACCLDVAATVTQRYFFRNLSRKIAVLGLAIVMVVPLSTHFVQAVGGDYLAYVDETIRTANAGADKINEIVEEDKEDVTLLERLTDSLKTAVSGVGDLLDYFKNTLKKCMNSVAILIVTTFVTPLLVFLFFRWLLNELFSISLPRELPRLPRRKPEEAPRQEKEEVSV